MTVAICCRKGSMSSNTTEMNKEEKKKGPPQIVKLNKALALLISTGTIMFCRLGLGAKVSRTSTFVPSDDPLERTLYYKLNAQKRKAAKIAEELAPGAGDDDNEDNEDSRTSAFEKKKRAANPLTPPIGKKKRRK
ncbi:hypothetical protein ACLB2K_076715 [Fragaria x ananassa]